MPTRDSDFGPRVGPLLAVGFQGVALDGDLRMLIDRGISGVVLFSRNIVSPEQVAALVADIKSYAGRPLYVAVDQEGGAVQRLRTGFTRLPSMRVLGSTGDVQLARRAGALLAQELTAVGVDVDFAPVIDVDTNPDNPVIADRAFGSDVQLVAEMGVALGQGLEDGGVASCGKHFPGHGDTELDSHLALPTVRHARQRLSQVELEPFRRWAEAGLASLMTAHVVFEALDPALPATMSKIILHDVLRGEYGYDGLVFSDDLEMKAVFDHFGARQAAVLGLDAGVDQFLVCHRAEVVLDVMEGLEAALREGRIAEGRLVDAERRVATFLARWAKPAQPFRPDHLRSPTGQELLAEIQEKARCQPHPRHDPTDWSTRRG